MKKSIYIAILLIFISICGFSQNLDPIIGDLTSFFEELSKELAPHTLQNELSGYGMNTADYNDKKLFFISTSMGANLTYGILKFIDEENTNFDVLNVYNLVNTVVEDSPGFVQDMYSMSKTFFPYLNLRLGVGFNFFFDTDVMMLFSIFPAALTDAVAGMLELEGFKLNSINMGIRIRKALLKDSGPFPGISIGVGYTYSNFHLGYGIPEYSQDIAGDKLSIAGDLFIDSVIHAAGIDMALSKKFGFFIPFFRVSSYYQWNTFSSGIDDFLAQITDSSGGVLVESDEAPGVVKVISEISVILNTGFELKMGGFILTPYSTFDISTKTFTANLEMRAEI
jgi:hypothetical protein